MVIKPFSSWIVAGVPSGNLDGIGTVSVDSIDCFGSLS